MVYYSKDEVDAFLKAKGVVMASTDRRLWEYWVCPLYLESISTPFNIRTGLFSGPGCIVPYVYGWSKNDSRFNDLAKLSWGSSNDGFTWSAQSIEPSTIPYFIVNETK